MILQRYEGKIIPFYVDNSIEGAKAVAKGQADAIIDYDSVLDYLQYDLGLTNVKTSGYFDFDDYELFIAVREDWPILFDLVQKARTQITTDELKELRAKWGLTRDVTQKNKVVLTNEEKQWLQEHPQFRIGLPLGFPGVSFKGDNGEMQGIFVDYLAIVSERAGISFDIRYMNWPELIENVKARKIDIIYGSEDAGRNEYLDHTLPFSTFFYVIVTRQDVPFIPGQAWLEGKKVTVVKDTSAHELLKSLGGDVGIMPFETEEDALLQVNYGHADAYLGDSVSASYIISYKQLGNLKIAAPAGFENTPVSYAVRNDWPELVGILNKAIASITPEEHSSIIKKWLSVRYEQSTDWGSILKWGAVTFGFLILVIFLILIWNAQLRRVVAMRTRELAEEKELLRESETMARALLNAPADSILLLNPEGVIMDANEIAALRFGASREELIGCCIWDRLPPELAEPRRAHVSEACRTRKPAHFEDGRDGVYYSNTLYPIFDEEKGISGVAVIARDITARIHAEAERERLIAAIEQADETIIITDPSGTIQYVNPAFERISGYSCEEAIGENPRVLKSGKHDEAFYEQMWSTLLSGQSWTGQVINRKRDGTLYTEDATISPVRDASGQIVNYVAVKRDITDKMNLEGSIAAIPEDGGHRYACRWNRP